MNTGKSATCMFIGCILIYVGIFGLTVPGLGFSYALLGDFDSTDWDTIPSEWRKSGTAQINPPGQLELRNTVLVGGEYQGRVSKQYSELPSQLTVEASLTLDSGGRIEIVVYSKTNRWYGTGIKPDGVGISGNQFPIANGYGQWHTWRITVDDDTQQHTVYRDGEVVGSVQSTKTHTDAGFVAIGVASQTSSDTEGHVDYTYIATGLYPPDEEPPEEPDYGSIQIYVWDGSNYVSVGLTITWPDNTIISTSAPYTNTMAPTGVYTVTCTYTSTKTHSFTLVKDQSYIYTFDFSSGGEEPPPDTPPGDGFDLWDIINQTFSNSIVKAIMTLSGVGMIGVGVIGIFSNRKRGPPMRLPFSY